MENLTVTKFTGSNGTFIVTLNGKRIGTISLKHRGWEARYAGVSAYHATKAQAVTDLASR